MGSKSGFSAGEVNEIKRLYLEEGRSVAQIAKILGKGSETSVQNALKKARISQSSDQRKKLERFSAGQTFGRITLLKQLKKSKKQNVCREGKEMQKPSETYSQKGREEAV